MIGVSIHGIPPQQRRRGITRVYKDKPLVAFLPHDSELEPHRWCRIEAIYIGRPADGGFPYDLHVIVRNDHPTETFNVRFNALWAEEVEVADGCPVRCRQSDWQWAPFPGAEDSAQPETTTPAQPVLFILIYEETPHAGASIKARCEAHLPPEAEIVQSEAARLNHWRRFKRDAWVRTTDYHPAHRCGECVRGKGP